MDNKFIFELIKKDIDELKLIIEALEGSPEPQPFLIDIAASKTQNLLQEVSMLNRNEKTIQANAPAPQNTPIVVDHEPEPKIQVEQPERTNEVAVVEKQVEDTHHESAETESKPELIHPIEIGDERIVRNTNDATISLEPTLERAPNKEKTVSEQETIIPKTGSIEVPLINEATPDEKKVEVEREKEHKSIVQENHTGKPQLILGEKFTTEPTLNERFTTHSDNQYKIKGKPVTSIKGAIGINDQFMFARELFDNNKNKFESTIEMLDKAAGFLDAVEYLEQNFQWKKTDTSLKFMELVKRRFEK